MISAQSTFIESSDPDTKHQHSKNSTNKECRGPLSVLDNLSKNNFLKILVNYLFNIEVTTHKSWYWFIFLGLWVITFLFSDGMFLPDGIK